ncbi:DUF2066 domain-containing protein [Alginatibacterium sediminis]|uniref:DUF2066 domain-containing protein n=1 Tax=Alginatibacterium sediminis TaxID=2164068 RepID=A0A420EBH5_9ALTE|nr:DUF2066 domain-containing protein [Alginatibacterium sediminis]RKF18038.1 DUF2066 domain-containing protein [Alginatibacterium sediminis]
MMTKLLTILLCSFALHSLPLAAQDFYQVNVAQSQNLEQDQKQAFAQLILRLSADDNLNRAEILSKAQSEVEALVLSSATIDKQRVIGFDGQKVETLLRQAEIKYWGSARPSMLMFYVAESKQLQRKLYSQSELSTFSPDFDAQMQDLGLNVLLPVYDLEDLMLLDANDVWGGFDSNMAKVAARYGLPLMLVIKQFEGASDSEIQWRIVETESLETVLRGQVQGPNALVFDDTIVKVHAQMVEHFGELIKQSASEEALVIKVTQVDNLNKLLQLEQFLRSQTAISQLTMLNKTSNSVSFELKLIGSWTELQKVLDLEPRLAADPADQYHFVFQ